MRLRRKILLIAVCAIGVADAAYIGWLRSTAPDESRAEWVAYMPKLEDEQRRNPLNLLSSWHGNDPDYPELFVREPSGTYPVFPKITADCKIAEYAINYYAPPADPNAPVQMPERLFLGKLSDEMRQCLRKSLPKGYVLARLEGEANPRRIGWGKNDLPIASSN